MPDGTRWELYLQALSDAMGSPTARPVLPEGALARHLERAKVRDADGRRPGDPEWTPTYSVDTAASAAWGQKAALCAGDFSFSADGASYSKADVMAHCAERQAYHAARIPSTMRAGGREWDSVAYQYEGLIP